MLFPRRIFPLPGSAPTEIGAPCTHLCIFSFLPLRQKPHFDFVIKRHHLGVTRFIFSGAEDKEKDLFLILAQVSSTWDTGKDIYVPASCSEVGKQVMQWYGWKSKVLISYPLFICVIIMPHNGYISLISHSQCSFLLSV